VEIMAFSNTELINFFESAQNALLYEIISPLPFFGTIFVNWIHAGEIVNSSFNVPFVTILTYIFPIELSLLIIFSIGLIHGIFFRIVNKLKFGWIVFFIFMIIFTFAGLSKNNVLDTIYSGTIYAITIFLISNDSKINNNSIEKL
jgi:hypothetical protein